MRDQKIARRTKHADQRSIDNATDVPSSWLSTHLGSLVDPQRTISYGVLVPGDHVPGGIPLVRAQDLSVTRPPAVPNKSIAPDIERPYSRTRLSGGEILLCVVGSIGKLGIAPATWAGANIARAVARIQPITEVSSAFVLLALQASPVQAYFRDATRTLAQPTLNIGLIELTPIPLPPMAEQHRIVAKVDELMSVCASFESSLGSLQSQGSRLFESLLIDCLADGSADFPRTRQSA
jgi:type I restriction enzyme S subunit